MQKVFKTKYGNTWIYLNTLFLVRDLLYELLIENDESLFSSLDFAVDFFGTKDAGFESFCTHGSILYKNIFNEVDILLGYGDCLDRHEENNYNSKETFIEIRNFLDHEMFFIGGMNIKIFRFEVNNNISHIGLLPMAGYGFNFGGNMSVIEAKIGYLIFDIDDIYSQNNGWSLRGGVKLYMSNFIFGT